MNVQLALVTPSNLDAVVDAAISSRIIGLDTETRPRPGIAYSGLDLRPYSGLFEWTCSRIAGVCIATDQHHGWYVPLQHDSGNIPHHLALLAFKRLGDAIRDGLVTVALWNSPFDQAMLAKLLNIQAWPRGSFIDGLILDRVLRPHAYEHRLKSACARTLGMQMLEFEAPRRESWVREIADHHLFKPRDNMAMDFGAHAPEAIVKYAAGDAVATLRYCMSAAAKQVRDDTAVLIETEHSFVLAVRAMPRNQIGYDRQRVKALADQYWQQRIDRAEQLRLMGLDNAGSPKQVSELLASKGFRGASTDKHALSAIPRSQPELRHLAQLIQEYRLADKYISAYLQPLINADHPSELCGSWQAAGAKSGRMSAGPCKGKKKGDQHVWATWLPHGQPKAREFRSLFVARPGYLLVKIDYSSQEYRVCAVLADAKGWLRVFNDPDPERQDVHALTARGLFPDYDQASKDQRKAWRQTAKTFNFATIYGAQAEKIGSMLGISTEQAQTLLARFYESEPALQRFQQQCQEQAKRFGRVYTYFGRPVAVRASDVADDGDIPVHASPNYTIQGTCGDLLKIAVNAFFAKHAATSMEIAGGDDSIRLINLVHDEVVLEVAEAKAHEIAQDLAQCMTGAAPSGWPLKLPVEISIGKSWGE